MTNFQNALVLVTGGAGAIGSNLVRELLHKGAKIIVLDDLSSGYEDNIVGIRDVQFIKDSITNDIVLKKIFSKPINYIFHLAASFANQKSVEDPLRDLNINIAGTLKILQHSIKAENLKRFVYVSSSCVYGNAEGVITEETNLQPETPYAISKLAAENYVRFFHKYYGLPIVILRYFNSYGPGEYSGKYRNVIPNFFNSAMSGLPLSITGTGEEIRSFVFVDDVVDATIKSALKEEAIGECFNIGSDNKIKIKNLAERINVLTHNKAGIKFIKRRKWDKISRRISNNEKAQKILDYNPKITLEKGLGITYKWFLNLKKNR